MDRGMLISLPGGQVGFLVFVNLFIFVIAFFLDFFEIAFIVVPLLAPVAEKLDIDLIWFGVCSAPTCKRVHASAVRLCFILLALRGSRESLKTYGSIYRSRPGRLPGRCSFMVIQVIMIILMIAFPRSVTY